MGDKIRNEMMMAILESDDFHDDLLDEKASDAEDIDAVTEMEEEDDIITTQEPEEQQDGNKEAGTDDVIQELPTYVAKDGTVWSKIPYNTRVKRAKHNIQKIAAGLTPYSSNFVSKKEAFFLFFDERIFDIIINETNRKAQTFYANKNAQFLPIVREELEAFIGLLFIFGALHSSKEPLTMLWSQDPIFCRPVVSAIMSRKRFKEIMCFLRFDNFETRTARRAMDKLAPIRDLFDCFVNNCKEAYNPGQHLCVDEQLVPFRGKAPFRVYMKSKPNKYGLKIWSLADCNTAYTLNMQVYLGKEGNKAEKGQGQRDVLDLVNHLPQGHGITTDNFFTSLELADKLLEKNLSLCGTLRRNKTFIPKELLPASYKKEFSSMFAFIENKSMVSYVPKKKAAVILLSTEHKDDKTGEENENYKPHIILHYNKTKGAVDTTDKLAKEYSTQRKNNRWPMAMFFHLLDIGGINSYKIWMSKYPDWEKGHLDNRRQFLLDLGKEMGRNKIIRRYNSCPTLQSSIKKNMRLVVPELAAEVDISASSSSKSGRCYLCDRKKDRKSRNECCVCKKYICKSHSTIKWICNKCQ